MQSEKKSTKYMKAKDSQDQQRRGLNNLIKQALGGEYKSVADLAEALIMLNINTLPSKETLMRFLKDEQDSINADIGEEIISLLCDWLKRSSVNKRSLNMQTPQTKQRSSAKYSSIKRRESDSDGQTESDGEDVIDHKEKLKQLIAERKLSTTTQKAESEDHVLQRLVSQGRKLNVDHIQALVSCHTDPDGVSSMQHTAAEIIRQSVDSEFHSSFELSHTWSSTINVQASMYLKALIIKHYELGPSASITQSQRIDEVIASYGKGDKDQHFDILKFASNLQQDRSAYEKIFELSSVPKARIKSVHETIIQLIQQVGRTDYPVNAYFAAQLQDLVERSSVEYSLDDVLSKIIEHHNRMKQIGPAKCDSPTDKSSEGKDSKKKSDKQTANPAFRSGAEGSITCQICSSEHSAKECPLFFELKKQSAIRRGELFPGKSDKDGKRKGTKDGKERDSGDEPPETICLFCTQLKGVPEWATKNHTLQECGQFIKFSKQRGEGQDPENRYRSERGPYQRSGFQRSFTDQGQPSPMQNPYADSSGSYSSAPPYPTQMPMPPQTWQSPAPSMPREMMGQYRSGGSSQMQRSANMSSLQSPRPHSSRDEMGEYEDMQRDPRNSFIPENRTMFFPQQSHSGTPSTVRSIARDPTDSSTANMATTPSFQGFLTDEQKESRDKFRRQMQGEYLFDLIQANSKLAMGAATMSDHRQAMPAIIVREHEEQTLTMLAQTGGEETTSSISAQTESENRVLVSEAYTQTEQMLPPETPTLTVSQIENQNEISIEEYIQTVSAIELRLKMSELTVQDIEEMKEEVLMHWDKADENWTNGKISGDDMEKQNEAFRSLLSTVQIEQTKIYSKTTENEEANVQVSYRLPDGQEQAIDSNADGRLSPDQAPESTTEHSNESDYNQLPGLIDTDAEEDMGEVVYKSDHIDSGIQPRAPGGPIKETRVGDSSKLTQTTINYQNEEDNVPEDHVTHWQEHEISDLRAIIMRWQQQDNMRRQEQAQLARDMYRRTWAGYLSDYATEDEQDHNYRNGPEDWESVD